MKHSPVFCAVDVLAGVHGFNLGLELSCICQVHQFLQACKTHKCTHYFIHAKPCSCQDSNDMQLAFSILHKGAASAAANAGCN
jgi:hypothetical protein